MAENENRKFLLLPVLVAEHDLERCAPDCPQLELTTIGLFRPIKRARCRGLGVVLGVAPPHNTVWDSGAYRALECREFATEGRGPETVREVLRRQR
jgi:hypothetical protein